MKAHLVGVVLAIALSGMAIAPAASAASQDPQQPPPKQQTVTGCLQKADEAFVLAVSDSEKYQVDTTAKDVDLNANVDHKVALTGTIEKTETASLLHATALKVIAESCSF